MIKIEEKHSYIIVLYFHLVLVSHILNYSSSKTEFIPLCTVYNDKINVIIVYLFHLPYHILLIHTM